MIRDLTLKNFKQHTDRTFQFGPGLNIIRGDNGSGKTSALKGILYALFGASAVGAKDHLKTWGKPGTMSATLTLSIPGTGTVKILRGFNKCQVTQKGEVIASGQTPVNKWVEDALGMSGKVLRNLLCAEQGKTQGLLDMGASGLQSQLEGIAKAEIIDDVMSLISTDISQLNGELKGIGEVENLIILNEQKTLAEKDLAAVTAELKEFQNKLRGARSIETKLTCYMDTEVYPARQRRNSLRIKLESYKQRLEEANAELAKINCDESDLEQLYVELEQSEVQRKHVTADLETANRVNAAVDRKKERLASSQAHYDKLKSQEEGIKTLRSLRDVFESKSDDTVAAQLNLDKIQKIIKDSACPTCKRAFDQEALDKAIAGKEAAIRVLSQTKEASDKARKDLREAEKLYQINIADFRSFSSRLEGAEKELESAVKEAGHANTVDTANMAADLEVITATVITLNTNIRVLGNQISAAKRLKEKAAELNKNISVINQELGTFSSDIDSIFESTLNEIEETRKLLSTLELQSAPLLEKKEQATIRFTTIDSLVKTEADKAERYQRTNNDLHQRSQLQKFLRSNRSKLIQDAWVSLTQYASYLIDITTEGLMTDLVRPESGEFYITEKGRQVPVSELSGARRSIIGLCLRIALAKLFYGDNGFTLLDEVTADCTEENAARVSGLLQSLKSQVIMITHRESDTANADVVIQM